MIESLVNQLNKMNQCKAYCRLLASEDKNNILLKLSEKLISHLNEILEQNKNDLINYKGSSFYQKAFEDRLTLTETRVRQMAEGLKIVATLKDVVGEVTEDRVLSNGLHLKRVRAPLGLIFLIFESRPNVITEAFSIAFKSGNGIILKGGKESRLTCQILYRLIRETLIEEYINPDVFWGLEDSSREVTDFLMKQEKIIDVLIPRGGDALIEHVTKNSRIPIIKNDRGLCHLYVHGKADHEMAMNILINAKTQRPGVCNSIETVLIESSIVKEFLPKIHNVLQAKGVELFVCDQALAILSDKVGVNKIKDDSFKTEYLDLKLNVKVVEDVREALEHIEAYGSKHSEAIVTSDEFTAKLFESSVDAAVVYWNASTRFTDGGEFGMGGEIGISTQKLQVRGPVGMEALTSNRWIVEGQGQIRK